MLKAYNRQEFFSHGGKLDVAASEGEIKIGCYLVTVI